MYKRAYGIIETLAPVHVGATAGEESGNLNLIFRDQFTQTGIIPGSSIRGRFKADLRRLKGEESKQASEKWYGKEAQKKNSSYATEGENSNNTTESIVKFEYASVVWLPVFCPGQPIVWVSCPRLLKRYQRIAGEHVKANGKSLKELPKPKAGEYSATLKLPQSLKDKKPKKKLFFNFGFLELKGQPTISSAWFPTGEMLPAIVVEDDEIGIIHDMALYRQSRIKLKESEKIVDDKAFFNVEALPESTMLAFPIAIRETKDQESWDPFNNQLKPYEIYLGGLESIGFGNCRVAVKGFKSGEQQS